MSRNVVKGALGAAMLAAGIAGIALVDASGPDKTTIQRWSDPLPCEVTVEQVVICELGSPVASPEPEPTPTFTAREEVDTITELPSTGTGPGR